MLRKKNIALLEGDRHQVDSGLDSIPSHIQKHADTSNGIFVHSKNCFVHQIHMCQKTNICKQSFDFFWEVYQNSFPLFSLFLLFLSELS